MNGPDADGQDHLDRDALDHARDSLSAEQEWRIRALVGEFLERLQSGDEPDPCEMILAHPDLAVELERRLTAAEELHHLGQSLAAAHLDSTHPQEGFPAHGIPAESPTHLDLGANSEATVDPTRPSLGRLGQDDLLPEGDGEAPRRSISDGRCARRRAAALAEPRAGDDRAADVVGEAPPPGAAEPADQPRHGRVGGAAPGRQSLAGYDSLETGKPRAGPAQPRDRGSVSSRDPGQDDEEIDQDLDDDADEETADGDQE